MRSEMRPVGACAVKVLPIAQSNALVGPPSQVPRAREHDFHAKVGGASLHAQASLAQNVRHDKGGALAAHLRQKRTSEQRISNRVRGTRGLIRTGDFRHKL